jgi:predicted site-specific integrase-resolvase
MNKFTEQDRLVKPDEAADLLALSRRTLRRYEVAGRLTPIKLNSRVTRYRVADLLRLIGKEVE